MPFDALTATFSDLAPPLEHPSIDGLTYLLRHHHLWPPGFQWAFRHNDHCAIELASQTWPRELPHRDDYITGRTQLCIHLCIPLDLAVHTFGYVSKDWDGREIDSITPEDVAMRLEELPADPSYN